MIETGSRGCIRVQLPLGRRRQANYAGESESIEFLIGSTEEWLSATVEAAEKPVLWLDIGLPPEYSLASGHNLDSYALAFAEWIKAATGTELGGLRLTKSHNPVTTLRLTDGVIEPTSTDSVVIKTRKSYAKPGFEADVRDATEDFSLKLCKREQFHLSIRYRTGLPRTWSRLLEPTIRGVLSHPNRELDGARITSLSLDHESLGESFEHWVEITISNRR